MKKTTITINGQEITADLGTIRAILGLSDMAADVTLEPAKGPKAPKAPKKAKGKKAAKKAEEPKAEESPKEPVYTHGGCILQWDDGITAKGQEKATITKAYNSLVKQGFQVIRKRVGNYVYLYHAKDEEKSVKGAPVFLDGKTSKEFNSATLDSGWTLIRGGWAYPELLKDYDDCFKPEPEC